MGVHRQKRILLVGLIVTAVASTVYLICRWSAGGCIDHSTVANFDLAQYLGLWYEFARSENVPFESGECITAEYALDGARSVSVVNTQYFKATGV